MKTGYRISGISKAGRIRSYNDDAKEALHNEVLLFCMSLSFHIPREVPELFFIARARDEDVDEVAYLLFCIILRQAVEMRHQGYVFFRIFFEIAIILEDIIAEFFFIERPVFDTFDERMVAKSIPDGFRRCKKSVYDCYITLPLWHIRPSGRTGD